MEHKLILSGEQYLPFARSRVKALRAAGLVYSRQTFLVDSYIITVAIDGLHSYIKIEGGEQPALYMDSGIVTGLVEGPLEANPFAPGVLRETTSVSTYVSPYTPITADPSWRTFDTENSSGQFAGIVTTPKSSTGRFAGKVRLDGNAARSFSPATRNTAQEGMPPVWENTTDDSTLLAKKICAAKRPASLFTGRCRMYVQALYGLHLYEVKIGNDKNPIGTGKTLSARSAPSISGGNAIEVPSYYKVSDKKGSLPAVVIDTNTGVFLDKKTGKHWLLRLSLNGTAAVVYPLLCSGAINKLRRYIKTPLSDGEKIVLSEADKEKLETYILAHSLPYAKGAVTIPLADSAIVGETMGYGWHWNWDGTAADCVFHSRFSQGLFAGRENFGMESSHYRVSITFEDNGFKPTLSLVSGPNRWGVNRAYWCFAKPNLTTGGCTKLTPQYSQMQAGSAAIYAFYRKNELNLCRIVVTSVPQSANTRVCVGGMSTQPTTYGGPVEATTAGLLGGSCLDTTGVFQHFTISVDCGTSSVSNLPVAKSEGFHRWVVSTKTVAADPVRDTSSEALFTSGLFYINVGYPPYSQVGPFPPNSYQGVAIPQVVAYTLTETTESVTTNSYVTCIVPAYDAESVFLHGESSTRTIKSGTVQSRRGGSYSRVGYAVTDGVLSPFYTAWNSSGPVVGNGSDSLVLQTDVSSDTTDSFVLKDIVFKDASRPAVFDSTAEFRDATLDETTSGIAVISGFRTDIPTIIAPGRFASVGTSETDFVRRALVGWI